MLAVIKSLARSRKFWLAVVAAVQTFVFSMWPNFDPEIWKAINVLIGLLIAAIAAEDVAAKWGSNSYTR